MKKSGFREKTLEEVRAINRAKYKNIVPNLNLNHQNKGLPKRRRALRVVGISSSTELKVEIQKLLRQIVILRDGGCFLRHFEGRIQPQYRKCGGYRNDGQLILQAEHLHSRSNAISFSDSRLVVCCCQRHHIYYKKQFGTEYDKFAREYIGPVRSRLWGAVIAYRSPYKVDLKSELLGLKNELRKLKEKHEVT